MGGRRRAEGEGGASAVPVSCAAEAGTGAASPGPLEADGAGQAESPGLPDIARTLEEAARVLRRHARRVRDYYPAPEPASAAILPAAEPGAPPPTALQVRAIVAVRRLRTAWLPDLSGDHAFSMLLELYAAHLEGRRIAQTRLGGVAGVPHTTAIRIAQALQAEGLVTAAADPADKRLTLLGLTDGAVRRMEAYLAAALAEGVPVV
jgi:DNA-binding MarR family transcriptional regulator